MREWLNAGATADQLAGLTIRIADLPGNKLADTLGRTITLDIDAAGWGWALSPLSLTADRMDLASVLAHELGHVLGLEHDDHGVMEEMLAPGESLPAPESSTLTIATGHPVNATTTLIAAHDPVRTIEMLAPTQLAPTVTAVAHAQVVLPVTQATDRRPRTLGHRVRHTGVLASVAVPAGRAAHRRPAGSGACGADRPPARHPRPQPLTPRRVGDRTRLPSLACAGTSRPFAACSRLPLTRRSRPRRAQYVRKVSGVQKPSDATGAAFERAVAAVTAATHDLLDALPPRKVPPKSEPPLRRIARVRAAAQHEHDHAHPHTHDHEHDHQHQPA